MRSINILATVAVVMFAAGCAPSPSADEGPVPVIQELGTRAHEFTSLDELAAISSAIVLVTPTDQTRDVPLPKERGGEDDSAPTVLVTVTVDKVLSGSLKGSTIEVVDPGTDTNTGQSALLGKRQFVLFITPAMYAADQPVGGYAIVGGPAGMFAKSGAAFMRVDSESPELPKEVDVAATVWPVITNTEEQLLHNGPR